MALAPLTIVVPALAAAALVGGGKHVPRRLADLVALAAAVATTVLCAVLLARVWDGHTSVHWAGGWHPRGGKVALGIDLAVGPLGAGAATFAGFLVSMALLYAQWWFKGVAPLFHGLVLVFLAGMVGLCLTGDLFNLFVFFELMSVPAYALAGYKTQHRGPLQGGLNFAVTNSAAGFLTLIGVALIYGRTGALNLAQIGESLAGHGTDGLVVVGFVLVLCGFLVKSAVVPFHFWLADAHATAPAPVSVLFSGIMVQLGLFAIARIYWTAFSGADGLDGELLRETLLVLGVLTAVLGGVMAFLQRHLKRLLAFSTISHSGIFLIGIAMLDGSGLAGTTVFVLAHGLTKGSLFMLSGIVGHRCGGVDEVELHGAGRRQRLVATGTLWIAGGLALCSLPPFGPFLGKALLEESATARGYGWVPIVLMVCSALAGGAILRAGAGIFLGWGTPRPPDREGEGESPQAAQSEEDDETKHEGAGRETPWVMVVPAALMMVAGWALPVISGLPHAADRAAAHFEDRRGYVAQVLRGEAAGPVHVHLSSGPHTSSVLYAVGAVLLGFALAAGALWGPRLEGRGADGLRRAGDALASPLRAWQSGHVGDYVTWLVVGVVVLAGVLANAAG